MGRREGGGEDGFGAEAVVDADHGEAAFGEESDEIQAAAAIAGEPASGIEEEDRWERATAFVGKIDVREERLAVRR